MGTTKDFTDRFTAALMKGIADYSGNEKQIAIKHIDAVANVLYNLEPLNDIEYIVKAAQILSHQKFTDSNDELTKNLFCCHVPDIVAQSQLIASALPSLQIVANMLCDIAAEISKTEKTDTDENK